ncbi:MAG: sensor domain-containing diguanylate cyclase [Nitrospirae bacterium]|nr:sensor domain-containing diguanylate cyclase [Nitrospirota bacterium]
MKKRTVLIFVEDKTVRVFLEKYFRKSDQYRPLFCSTVASLNTLLPKDGMSAVITEASLLQLTPLRSDEAPLIVVISGGREKGIAAAAAHKAAGYIVRPFLTEDLEFTLRSAIQNNEVTSTQKKEIKDLRTVNELTHLISSTLDPKEILYLIVKKIAEIMPVSRCSIIRIDWANKNLYVVASYETPDISTIKLSLKKYPEIAEFLKRKKPVLIEDITTDPIMKPVRDLVAPLGIKTILVLPIIFEQKVIGTLFLRTSKKRRFSAREIRLLNTITDVSSNTLYNAYLFTQTENEKTQLKKLAITDYFTGIFNVRYFYHRLIEEFNRSERYGLPISCLMIDIDFFKKINDTFGHKTGDLVLKEFASHLKRCSRKSDLLARYGGEEFIMMLPQTTEKGAFAEAERIRKAVRVLKFKSLKGRAGLTVSIGVSTFPHAKITNHDHLISAADDALYKAKHGGRNCVIVFD